jgi:glycosyltransferase involved in cell wall biosynthesis
MKPVVDVSIVICTRNRAAQLGHALEAVARMRAQCSWEAVVVDNGSSDHTAEVIAGYASRDPRFRLVHEAQQGLGAARDTAWRQASGAIVSFTDDDCYVAGDFVDRIFDAFSERPDVGYIAGRILLHDPTDAPITIMTREDTFDIVPRSFIAPGVAQGANLSFRREVLEAIGGFSRDMGAGTPFPCEDVDAVAEASWHGFAGGYDPRPTVSHHHGRKEADIPRVIAGYDAGRAAYYAKFMSMPQSRWAYLIAFVRRPIGRTLSEQLVSSKRIAVVGSRYLMHRRQPSMIPLLGLAIFLQASASLFRFARGVLRRIVK